MRTVVTMTMRALLAVGLLQLCALAQETVTFSTSSHQQLLKGVTFWSDVHMWHTVHHPDEHELLTEVNARSYTMSLKSDVEQINDNDDPYTTDFSKFNLNVAGKAGKPMAAFFPFIRECKRISDSLRVANPSLAPFTLSLKPGYYDRYAPDWLKSTAPGTGQLDSTKYAEYAENIYYQCKTYKDSTGVDVVSIDPVSLYDMSPSLLVKLLDSVGVYLDARGLHPGLEFGSFCQNSSPAQETNFLDMIHLVFTDTIARKYVTMARVAYGINIFTASDAFMAHVADSSAKYGFEVGIDFAAIADDHPTWPWINVGFPFANNDWTPNAGTGLLFSTQLTKLLNTSKATSLRLNYLKNFETSMEPGMVYDTAAKSMGLDDPASQAIAWRPPLYYLIRHLLHHTNVGSTYVVSSTSTNAKLLRTVLYDTVSNKVCILLVNTDTSAMQVNLSGGSFNPGTYDVYRLSAHEVDSRLSSVNAGSAITLPAQSTTILTNDYTPVTAGAVTASVLSVQGITPYSCDLRWRNTDPMAVSYDIYRGATMVESSYTIAPYYSATGLQPNTAYSFSLKAKDSQGNYSAFSNTVTFTTHAYQKVIREVWYCPGYRTSDIPLTAAPDKYQELDSINTVGSRAPGGEVNGMTDFFDVTGSNFGSRIRGYFVALASGWYRFYFNSYDYGDLYLSTDSLPANKRRIAWFDTYNVSPADSGVWNRYTGQTSDSISLVSGAWYYLEVLHKVTNHTPRLQVAWSGPGQASPTILRTPYMQPYPSNGMTVGALPRTLPEVKAVLSLAVVNSSTASRTPLVRFCLPSAQGHVALTLNDLQGRVVRRIVDGAVTGGMHVVAIDGSGNAVPAGTYVVRLRAGAIDKSMAVTLAR